MLVASLFGISNRGYCVVLYYHSVPQNQQALFASQLDTLLRHARPIDVNGHVDLHPGAKYAGITFDDAFDNFAQCALPELQTRQIPATVFVITDAIGKAYGPAGRAEKVMSLEQLRSLPTLVTIGSHTATHPMLPLITQEEAYRELTDSRKKLEELLNRRIKMFSFPFGGFSQNLVDLCRQAGYERIFTTLPKNAFATPNEFVVGRVRVDPTDWPLEFRLKLTGAYRWLPTAFALKKQFASNPIARLILGRKRNLSKESAPPSAIQELGSS